MRQSSLSQDKVKPQEKNLTKLADLLKNKIAFRTQHIEGQKERVLQPSIRLLAKIKLEHKDVRIHGSREGIKGGRSLVKVKQKPDLEPISGRSIVFKLPGKQIQKRKLESPSPFSQFEMAKVNQKKALHSSMTDRRSGKKDTGYSREKTSKTEQIYYFSDKNTTTEAFFPSKMDGEYVNLLEQMDDDEDEGLDAIEHHIQEVLSGASISIEWVKASWNDLIPIFKQKYSNVSYLVNFEKILQLYHFITVHIYELRNLDFSQILSSPSYQDPYKGRSFLDRTSGTLLPDFDLKSKEKKNKGFFITELAKKNKGNMIWKNDSSSKTTLSWNSLKEKHLYFIGKGLLFMFKATEDFIGGGGLDYSQLVINLESTIRKALKNDKSFISSILNAYSRLFSRMCTSSFTIENEEFTLLSSSYLSLICQALENYTAYFSTGEKLYVGIDWETFRMDENLEYILRAQQKRNVLVDHASHRLIRYFEILKELLIVVPKGYFLFMANVYSTMMVFTSFSQTLSLLRHRFGQQDQINTIFHSVIIQINSSTEALLSNEYELTQVDHKDKNQLTIYFEVCKSAFTSLERHFMTPSFYERMTRIELDPFLTKELLLHVHCLARFSLDKRRKNNAHLVELCMKNLSVIQHYISSEIFAANNHHLLHRFSSLKPQLTNLHLLFKKVSKADPQDLNQLSVTLSSLIAAFD